MSISRFLLTLALVLATALPATAQSSTPPKREFRGVWIATVTNLDWPDRGASTAQQQQALISMLDKLQALNINAVLFQIRTEADALYASTLEPWSYWLTGVQGKAPAPFYDPLDFAIEEAHKRGMELHAWFNPYRAERSRGSYPTDPLHVTQQHPSWLLTFTNNNIAILDPGKQVVRDYNTNVVMDVVRRYDIDGVHFDDYFYPYPSSGFSGIASEDDATFAAEPRGFTNRGDWRRDNINIFIKQVSDSIATVKPHVKFGVSPFGIYRPGQPSGTTGLDAYNVIYADAVAWLNQGSLDYLTPQLYWPFGGGQNYGFLAPWWRDRALSVDRHMYPGHGLYKSDRSTFSGTLYSATEMPRQVRYNRDNNILGSVHFRAKNLTQFSSQGFADSLRDDLYRYPALAPVMPWKEQVPPNAPVNFEAVASGPSITLTWEPPGVASDGDVAMRYALYRFSATPTLPIDLGGAEALVAVLGGEATSYVDTPPASGVAATYQYVLTALDRNWNESTPSTLATATGVEASTALQGVFSLEAAQPNPFSLYTEIAFTVREPMEVTLRVYNLLGQEVATLLERDWRAEGTHRVAWSPDTVGNGTYLVTLEAQGARISRLLTRLR